MNVITLFGLVVTFLQYYLLFQIGKLLKVNKELCNYLGINKINSISPSENSEDQTSKLEKNYNIEMLIAQIGTIVQYLAIASFISELISTLLVLYRLNFEK
jgi:hypothetical protein